MGLGPTGFERAPVAKFVFGTFLLATCAHIVLKNDVVLYMYFDGFFTKRIVYDTPGASFTGLYLFYHLGRMFERRLGSRKFGSFVLSALTMCYFFEKTLLFLLSATTTSEKDDRTGGIFDETAVILYATVPMIVPYFVEVPSTFNFTILGVSCGNTIFVYLAILQLSLTKGYASILSTAVSVSSGLFSWIFIEAFGIRIPRKICTLTDKTFGRVIDSKHSRNRDRSGRYSAVFKFGARSRSGVEAVNRQRREVEVDREQFQLSTEALETLVSMGFPSERVQRMLALTNNNLEEAMNMLLHENR